MRNGELIASGAVGTRRAGTNDPVTIDDRFHIGSDTKAMTALIAATLVEEGTNPLDFFRERGLSGEPRPRWSTT